MVDGEGEGTDMLEDDDDEAVFVNTFESALDALEGTVEELHGTPFLAEEVGVRKKSAVVVFTLYIHGSHEVLHLTVRNCDDNGGLVCRAWLDGHILHRHTATVKHFQFAQLGTVGIDKDEVVKGWLQAMDYFFTTFLRDANHWDVVLDAGIVEGLLNLEFTAIRYIHGVPLEQGIGTSACISDTSSL